MTQTRKKELWDALKNEGVVFDLHYREYTIAQLQKMYNDRLRESQPVDDRIREAMRPALANSVPERDVMAGLRLNTHANDQPLRTDADGTIWYQDEVRKPAIPKPRGRRVLKYTDTGVETRTFTNGRGVTETFEMPGTEARQSEARITLPSYQVGIFRDPRYPFKIHEYNDQRGFDLFEVEDFYGGPELVPSDVKRIYVSNTLCYDIRTVVRAIQSEYRDSVLRQGATS